MKKKEIRKEFYDKWDNTKEFELGKSFNYYKDANKVWKWVEGKIDKAREEKIQNIFTREECVIVEPRYISDWSDKYNKHFKCNRCKSKCLIPVIEPLVVICPKCGELDLDEIS